MAVERLSCGESSGHILISHRPLIGYGTYHEAGSEHNPSGTMFHLSSSPRDQDDALLGVSAQDPCHLAVTVSRINACRRPRS
jgi:hypothetical protein